MNKEQELIYNEILSKHNFNEKTKRTDYVGITK